MEMDELNALINEVWLRNEGVLLKNLKKRKLQLQKQPTNLSNDPANDNLDHATLRLVQEAREASMRQQLIQTGHLHIPSPSGSLHGPPGHPHGPPGQAHAPPGHLLRYDRDRY